MQLKQTLPSWVHPYLGGGEIKFSLPADINTGGSYCEGWVVATPQEVLAITPEGVQTRVAIGPGMEFKAVGVVGNCHFEAKTPQGDQLIARCTMRYYPHYSLLARNLTAWGAGRPETPSPPLQEAYCPRCGRAYPDDAQVCPKCINKLRLLKRLGQVSRPHMGLMIAASLLFWLLTAIRLTQPQVIRRLVEGLLAPQAEGGRMLIIFVSILAGLNLSSALFSIFRGRVMVLLGSRLARDLRQKVFSQIQALSLGYINQKKTGDLMNRVTDDTRRVQQFLEHHAAMVVNEGLVFIGVGLILFMTNWRLAILVLLPAPFVLWFSAMYRNWMWRVFHRQWRSWDRANSLLQDILSGMKVVKAFGQEKREVGRFAKQSRELADIMATNEKNWNTIFPALGFVMGLGNFLVLYYGGRLVLGQELSFGELVQFSTYAGMIYGPLRFMAFIPRWFSEAMTATERIFEIIDEEPELRDKENALDHEIKGEVVIKDVRFGYRFHEAVLEEIDLHVASGEMIGLVGHSGAGKSTLINLISRFYDPDEGAILIDGVDIRDIAQEKLRGQIGVVLQEPFLFSGSVYENIRYAKPEATPDEVFRATRIANAHDFIMKFPDGYDTRVGEKGQRLSGGERQRIAIARAILHNPRILILDEATASLDTETEALIQEALARLVKDRTTFAIAHRLSTLRAANRLVVLDKGKVAEIGTHEELIARQGIYYKLVMAQREMTKVKEAQQA